MSKESGEFPRSNDLRIGIATINPARSGGLFILRVLHENMRCTSCIQVSRHQKPKNTHTMNMLFHVLFSINPNLPNTNKQTKTNLPFWWQWHEQHLESDPTITSTYPTSQHYSGCWRHPTTPDFGNDFFFGTAVCRCITSWWFQPIWKILVKVDHFPK